MRRYRKDILTAVFTTIRRTLAESGNVIIEIRLQGRGRTNLHAFDCGVPWLVAHAGSFKYGSSHKIMD